MTAGSQAAVKEVDRKMRNLTLVTTLSALLVSLPLAGASAQTLRGPADGAPTQVDRFTTSSIGSAAAGFSYEQQLDNSLDAAEATVRTKGGASAHVRSDIQALRHAVAAEAQANGGELSEASYYALRDEVQALHRQIEMLPAR